MSKKLTISLILTAVVLSILLTGCINQKSPIEEQKKSTNPNLKFSVDSCDPEIIKEKEESRGIINSTWLNDDTFLITGFTHSTCGGCSLDGDYEVLNQSIILKTEETCGDVVTNCMCPKMITFEISNLERKDYSISFQ